MATGRNKRVSDQSGTEDSSPTTEVTGNRVIGFVNRVLKLENQIQEKDAQISRLETELAQLVADRKKLDAERTNLRTALAAMEKALPSEALPESAEVVSVKPISPFVPERTPRFERTKGPTGIDRVLALMSRSPTTKEWDYDQLREGIGEPAISDIYTVLKRLKDTNRVTLVRTGVYKLNLGVRTESGS